MKLIDRITQALMAKPSLINIAALNKMFQMGIPFNASHGLKIQELQQKMVTVKIPYKFFNLNHLKGMHACSIALVGEYCAGLLLAKNFGFKEYRLILKDLACKYHYQGRMDLMGSALLPDDVESLRIELKNNNKADFKMKTTVKDLKDNHVADVWTTWQLKKWENR